MKPTGLDWLPEVPKHWEILRAKYLFNEVDRRSISGSEVLLSLRMYQGLVPHSEVSDSPISEESLVGFKQVEPSQIVMNRMRASIGLFGLAKQSGLVSPDYAVFDLKRDIESDYYLHLFKTRLAGNTFRLESKGLGTGSSGFMRLYTDRFGIIKMPVPPVSEQKEIVEYLSNEMVFIARTSQRIMREIELIREYRVRLISDVVTGKLDVRDVDLPEVEEDEAEPVPLDPEAGDLGEMAMVEEVSHADH